MIVALLAGLGALVVTTTAVVAASGSSEPAPPEKKPTNEPRPAPPPPPAQKPARPPLAHVVDSRVFWVLDGDTDFPAFPGTVRYRAPSGAVGYALDLPIAAESFNFPVYVLTPAATQLWLATGYTDHGAVDEVRYQLVVLSEQAQELLFGKPIGDSGIVPPHLRGV